MSLECIFKGYPSFTGNEQEKEHSGVYLATPITTLVPAQVSGTIYLKLIRIMCPLDICTLRGTKFSQDFLDSLSQIYIASQVVKIPTMDFMTLPSLNHGMIERERVTDLEMEQTVTEDDTGVACMLYKRRNKYGHSENTGPQRQQSHDEIDEPNSKFQ